VTNGTEFPVHVMGGTLYHVSSLCLVMGKAECTR